MRGTHVGENISKTLADMSEGIQVHCKLDHTLPNSDLDEMTAKDLVAFSSVSIYSHETLTEDQGRGGKP